MDENLQEDWLDARLREEAAYIDDAGFTARVVQKLPARAVGYSLRAVILLGLTCAGFGDRLPAFRWGMVYRRRRNAFCSSAASCASGFARRERRSWSWPAALPRRCPRRAVVRDKTAEYRSVGSAYQLAIRALASRRAQSARPARPHSRTFVRAADIAGIELRLLHHRYPCSKSNKCSSSRRSGFSWLTVGR